MSESSELLDQTLEVPSDSFDWISLSLGILALFLVIIAVILNYLLKRDAAPGPTGPQGPARGATGPTGPTGLGGVPGSNGSGTQDLKLNFQTISPGSNQNIVLGGDSGRPLANSFYLLEDKGGTVTLELDPTFNFGSVLFLSADQVGASASTTITSNVYSVNNSSGSNLQFELTSDRVLMLVPFFKSDQSSGYRLNALIFKTQS